MKKIYIFIATIAILLIGVLNIKNTKQQSIEVNEIPASTQSLTTEVQKNYTQYEANITFRENHFKGKQIIHYVYDGDASISKLLFKLYLNIYSKDSNQKPYFMDQKPPITERQKEYGYISVSEIKVDGQSCESIETNGDLWVTLPKHIQKGQAIEIEMKLEGCVPNINYRIGSIGEKTWVNGFLPHIAIYDKEQGWVATNRYMSENYIYADIADYNVSLNVDKNIMPIASGVLIEEMDSSDGNKKYVFKAKRVRDFGVYFGQQLNKFRIDLKGGKNVYIYSKGEIDIAKSQTKLQEVFDYYGRVFGTYPYESFSIIDDAYLINVVSYPNLMIGNFEKILAEENKLYEVMSRQWLPYIIMHHPIKEAYLNEGLGFYIGKRATMSVENIRKYIDSIKKTYNFEKINELPYTMYKNYYKEEVLRPLALFAEMEETVGERKFKELLGEYYKKYAFRQPKESDFLTFFLEEGNMPLSKGFYQYKDLLHRKEDNK